MNKLLFIAATVGFCVALTVAAAVAQTADILQAVQKQDLGAVTSLLEDNPDLISAGDPFGRQPIHFAANSGNLEMVTLLLDLGADPKALTDAGTSTMHFAAVSGNVDIIKLLIEQGVPLDKANDLSATPLFYAVQQGHAEAAGFFLDRGAEAGIKDASGQTTLHLAAKSGSMDLAGKLLARGLAAGEPDRFGKSPLFYAAENGHRELADLLRTKDAQGISRVSADGSTLLHAAASGGLQGLAGFLIENGAAVNAANRFRETPLDLSDHHGHAEMSEFLMAHGGTPGGGSENSFDGDYIDPDVPGAEPVLFAPGFISTSTANERDIAFSASRPEMYFTRWLRRDWDIMRVSRTASGWGPAEKTSFSSPSMEAEAYFTPDEQRLFFISNRPPAEGGGDQNWEIWYVTRDGGGWTPAAMLGGAFMGGFYTTFTKTGTMYLTLNNQLCRAEARESGFADPEPLPEAVNSSGGYNSFVAPDESYIIFSTQRADEGLGDGDLYISFRDHDGTWTTAVNMGPTVNSFARDYCPSVSPDGRYFFFASRRLGTEDIFWMEAKVIEQLRGSIKR